ncbi:MAG: hypothetical protein GXP37_10695, partial [Chloroflexi bacterium]|nr:hypothetical protein [Chloroflexota bacterium]
MSSRHRFSFLPFLLAFLLFLALLGLGMIRPPVDAFAGSTQPPREATPAYCQGSYIADTSDASNTIDTYSCRPDWPETGPEHFYRLKTSFTQALTLTLSYSDAASRDLDLFLLSEDDPSFCYAGDASLTVSELPAGDHFIVVDGYAGSSGPYALTVDCIQQPLATVTPTPTAPATATATPTSPPSPT